MGLRTGPRRCLLAPLPSQEGETSPPCRLSFPASAPAARPNNSGEACPSPTPKRSLSSSKCDPKHRDCLLREFRKLCAMVAENPSYNTKTQIIQDFLRKGSAGGGCWSARGRGSRDRAGAGAGLLGL